MSPLIVTNITSFQHKIPWLVKVYSWGSVFEVFSISKQKDPHARSFVASTHVSHQPSASRAHLCFTLMFICLGLHTFSHADPKHLTNMQVGGGVLGIVSFLVICKSIYWILESYKWTVEFTGLINTTHFYIIFTHFQTIPS